MNLPENLDHLKVALRDQLCAECPQRPAEDPVQCEEDCTLFVNLPRLARVAKEGEPPCGYGVYAKELAPTHGDTPAPDIVLALTILETAIANSAQPQCDDGGCKRLSRIETALACLPKQSADDEGGKA